MTYPKLVQRKLPIITYLLTEGSALATRPVSLGAGCGDYHSVSSRSLSDYLRTHPHLNHHHLSLTIMITDCKELTQSYMTLECTELTTPGICTHHLHILNLNLAKKKFVLLQIQCNNKTIKLLLLINDLAHMYAHKTCLNGILRVFVKP